MQVASTRTWRTRLLTAASRFLDMLHVTSNVAVDEFAVLCGPDRLKVEWIIDANHLAGGWRTLLRLCTFDIRSTVDEITLRSLGSISRTTWTEGTILLSGAPHTHKHKDSGAAKMCQSNCQARLGGKKRKKKNHTCQQSLASCGAASWLPHWLLWLNMSPDNIIDKLSDGNIWTQLFMLFSSAVSMLSNFSSNTLVAELG